MLKPAAVMRPATSAGGSTAYEAPEKPRMPSTSAGFSPQEASIRRDTARRGGPGPSATSARSTDTSRPPADCQHRPGRLRRDEPPPGPPGRQRQQFRPGPGPDAQYRRVPRQFPQHMPNQQMQGVLHRRQRLEPVVVRRCPALAEGVVGRGRGRPVAGTAHSAISFATAANCSAAKVRSSSVWAAEIWVRMRAVSFGTTG